ncbi:glutathionylspermidine synthase family protein [Brasilonema sp. CT11]|nr:glutathionylspermidine synthase family protein [Brasilonema sp. CT11]
MDLNCYYSEWQCSPQLDEQTFAQIRNQLALYYFKWDSQVGDVSTLAPFAIIVPNHVWQQLAKLAEQLTAEALAAEYELLQRPELLKQLGLPRQVQKVLSKQSIELTPAAARVVRFDFHPTPVGWRISEANSDVPGGYTEAANFSKLMAQQFPGTKLAGDPSAKLSDALAQTIQLGGHIALLSAPGYMEDQQITAYLAELIKARGCTAHLATPAQIQWHQGVAYLQSECYQGSLAAVMRFFQGEWLIHLKSNCDWSYFFRGSKTPICNPGSVLLIESKRFPLVWDKLDSPLDTWKALLPKTRDPCEVNWLTDTNWLLKSAYCNTGDTVTMWGISDRTKYIQTFCDTLLHPGNWIAQRRFQTNKLQTPLGIMYPCMGVYTVNSKAVGIYGRIARKPLIDFAAIDVAVLIQD